jgi:DNA-binding NarL/FixJ family response regulator
MGRPLNLLLIEDSTEIREALIQNIEASGVVKVSGVVDNSNDAIRLIDHGGIDAAIIDLQLKQGSGFLVLSHLAQSGNPNHILRIVLTNHTQPTFRHSCASLGADHFLDKSLEFDRAIELLEEFAGQQPGLS